MAIESSLINAARSLPEKPLVVIEPRRNWAALNLRELWFYRDLLYILARRDIKVRYKQTVLGAAWAIIQPLFTMAIFWLFFGKLTGVPSDGLPYPLFAYAGLVMWTFFSNAVTNSGNSLVIDSNLITKVYFPRMIIPVASVVAGFLDLAIAFGLLILMMFFYDFGFSVNMLMLPVLIVLIALLAVGIGMWMSALNVKYRDVRYALPFLIQLGMFATPIIYPLSIVPEKWRWLMSLNPLVGLIEAFRAACFNKPFDWLSIGISVVVTFIILIFTAYSFRKMEDDFADIV
jgi:lipopolysaccharide transport system permease protein